MLFHTFTFAVFFTLVSSIYFSLRGRFAIQNVILLAASYVFYGWWDARFLILIALSTLTDFLTGLGASGGKIGQQEIAKCAIGLVVILVSLFIANVSNFSLILTCSLAYAVILFLFVAIAQPLEGRLRKTLFIWFSVVANLGTLGFFKYFNFFAQNLEAAAASVGWQLGFVTLNIVLPVGLSFYTFQTMSYTIDCYRGVMQPTRNFVALAAYIAFFPQLVAGPIERASALLPQFFARREITLERLKSGSVLFLWGLYKKLVVADNLAPIADAVFKSPNEAHQAELLAGVIAFMFQIYCDFSAYSDMARGTARVLGFDLSMNFNLPYFSRSPSEFWRRWHISLSTWLRDYVYIPLGGSRVGGVNTYRNLMVTMLLGGFWHGAAWTFVVWGAFHGSILAIYRATGLDSIIYSEESVRWKKQIIAVLSIIVMLQLTAIGWILFRSKTLTDAYVMTTGLMWPDLNNPAIIVAMYYILPLLLLEAYQMLKGEHEFIHASPGFIRLNIVLFVLLSILFLSSKRPQQFIYFDF